MKKTKLLIAAFLTFNFGLLTLNSNAQFTQLYNFIYLSGDQPYGSLISDGTFLYGATTGFGVNNAGTLFKIMPDGTGFVKLYDLASGVQGDLILAGTFLYGMTAAGGTNQMGNIFKIKPDGTGYIDVFDFAGATNGRQPRGSLISDGTFLYGMTSEGGTGDIGTGTGGVIFKIKLDGTGYVNLHNFGSVDGYNPYGSLISDGTFLYGMTKNGGDSGNNGMIFKIKLDGTGYVDLLNFGTTNHGSHPYGSLFSDGTFLYGMTEQGGNPASGNIFKIMPDGTGFVNLYLFASSTNGGDLPYASLISDGTFLYGMTMYGGANGNNGTIFKIMPDGTGFIDLFDFSGYPTNGGLPYGSLFLNAGCLYGMTSSGGTNGNGTIFKYCLATAGIVENSMQTDFTISPNPSSGIFNLKMNVSDNLKMKNVEVYNVIGEKVYQSKINNPQSEIDLSSQPAGIYFLHLQTEQGNAAKKIIISQ